MIFLTPLRASSSQVCCRKSSSWPSRDALRLSPQNAEALNGIGLARMQRQRFLDAAGIMKRPKRNNPEKAIPRKERKAKEEEAAKAAGAAPAAEGGAKPAEKPKAEKPAEVAPAR